MRLVFLDLETMGLLPTSPVVEIGIVLAEPLDGRFVAMSEWQHVVPHSEQVWRSAQEGAARMHEASGLREHSVEKAARLPTEYGHRPVLAVAEQAAVEYLTRHGFKQKSAIIAGNSVGQDRVWIATQMPALHEFLHHRMVDVSSLRVLLEALAPSKVSVPKKAHTAVADCKAAIAELNGYLRHFGVG